MAVVPHIPAPIPGHTNQKTCFARKIVPVSGATPAGFAASCPDSGAGYFFEHTGTDMHRHPSCIRIPRRTLSVSHVLIIHIILGKIKLIFEF